MKNNKLRLAIIERCCVLHPVSILQNECGSPVWKRVNNRLSENLWEGEGGVNVIFKGILW